MRLDAQARSDVIIDDVPRDVRTVEVRLVGADPCDHQRAGPARRRRPRLGRHPARPHAPDPRRRRGRSVPRDRAVVPAQRRAVRRESGRVRAEVRPDRRTAVGPRHLRGLSPGDPAADADPGHRPAAHQPARRGGRHADEPGHRDARSGRAGPALRRPVDDPHRRGVEAARRPTGRGRSSRGRGARRCSTRASATGRCRGPRLRAAPLRPAAPGRLPDPAREPDRRAAGRLGGTDRGGRAGHARSSCTSRSGRWV